MPFHACLPVRNTHFTKLGRIRCSKILTSQTIVFDDPLRGDHRCYTRRDAVYCRLLRLLPRRPTRKTLARTLGSESCLQSTLRVWAAGSLRSRRCHGAGPLTGSQWSPLTAASLRWHFSRAKRGIPLIPVFS